MFKRNISGNEGIRRAVDAKVRGRRTKLMTDVVRRLSYEKNFTHFTASMTAYALGYLYILYVALRVTKRIRQNYEHKIRDSYFITQ